MSFRLSLLTLSTAFVAAPSGAATSGGALLAAVPQHHGNDWAIIDLPSGTEHLLPRSLSAQSAGSADTWSASAPAAHTLVRVSRTGAVEFFDSNTLQPVGAFRLADVPGTHTPRFVGDLHLSPDGQHVVGYWKSHYRAEWPELVVFDRQGRIADSGSPVDYDTFAAREAVTWLPDGRYFYLAGDKIVISQLGKSRSLIAPLRLPPGVGSNGARIGVSPDGRRLAWSLVVTSSNRAGTATNYGVTFVSGLDGSGMRPLTRPSARLVDHGIAANHTTPSWSSDGRTVFMVPGGPSAYGTANFQNACPHVIALPADGAPRLIDGLQDPPDLTLRTSAGEVRACGHAQWIAR